MAEMLFGSGPQLWPALPGLTFVPPYLGNRLIASAPQSAITLPPGALAGGLPTTGSPAGEVGQPMVSAWPAVAAAPVAGTAPVLAASPEYAAGVTPQALLAVVAMRRGQPMGPTTDQEVEDFIGDALDLLPGANDVEVRCENGRATVTGAVPNKRVKRDVGEIVWAIPSVSDLQNNITIMARRRTRAAGRDTETPSITGPGRKQA